MSKMVRALSENGGIMLCALDSTDLVQKMQQIHEPSATVTAALGRLLTGCALMGATLKSTTDTLSLRVQGNGPCGLLFAAVSSRATA